MKAIIIVAVLGLLTACQQAHRQHQQASALCSMDFGLTSGTSNYQNCKEWVLHSLQTGIEPDYVTFVCDSVPTANRKSCLEKQQAVYQEMMRVNKEVEAVREEDRKRRQEGYARQAAEAEKRRQEQVHAQEQADHQKCTGYGLKKGTAAYAECRMKIETERANEERRARELQALQQQQQEMLRLKAEEQARIQSQRQFNAGLAIMQGVPPHEAYMMQDNPEGYRQYKMQQTLEEMQQDMKNINCTSRKDDWGNVTTHCY